MVGKLQWGSRLWHRGLEAGVLLDWRTHTSEVVLLTCLHLPDDSKMNEETILNFIKKGESETVEFKSTQKSTQITTQKKSTKDQIIDILRGNPKLTRGEMAQLLGKSQNTIKDNLAALKSENRVERIGSDRDGYWRVK